MSQRPKISAAIRHAVSVRDGYRCRYCRSPQWAGVPMVVEHIIPLAAGGSSEIENLCLACYRCNEFKWARLKARDPLTRQEAPIFNPQTQVWMEHFAWRENGLYVVGLTATGRATVELLRLNNEWLVQARQIWIFAGIHPPLD